MLDKLYAYKQRFEKEYLLAKAKIQVIDEMISEEIRVDTEENATEIAHTTEVAERPMNESY